MRPIETCEDGRRVTNARGTKNCRSQMPEERKTHAKSAPHRTLKAALAFAKPRKMMIDSENVSDSDGESIDASLLEAIEHPRIERWPLDNDLTRVICSFVPRTYAQASCISRSFRDLEKRCVEARREPR